MSIEKPLTARETFCINTAKHSCPLNRDENRKEKKKESQWFHKSSKTFFTIYILFPIKEMSNCPDRFNVFKFKETRNSQRQKQRSYKKGPQDETKTDDKQEISCIKLYYIAQNIEVKQKATVFIKIKKKKYFRL